MVGLPVEAEASAAWVVGDVGEVFAEVLEEVAPQLADVVPEGLVRRGHIRVADVAYLIEDFGVDEVLVDFGAEEFEVGAFDAELFLVLGLDAGLLLCLSLFLELLAPLAGVLAPAEDGLEHLDGGVVGLECVAFEDGGVEVLAADVHYDRGEEGVEIVLVEFLDVVDYFFRDYHDCVFL